MEDRELNNKVDCTLQEFESFPDMLVSDAWQQDLMKKIGTAKLHHESPFSKLKLVVVILFIALINLGFLLSSIIIKPHHILSRNNNLQIISKELLINPVGCDDFSFDISNQVLSNGVNPTSLNN